MGRECYQNCWAPAGGQVCVPTACLAKLAGRPAGRGPAGASAGLAPPTRRPLPPFGVSVCKPRARLLKPWVRSQYCAQSPDPPLSNLRILSLWAHIGQILSWVWTDGDKAVAFGCSVREQGSSLRPTRVWVRCNRKYSFEFRRFVSQSII